MPAPGEPPHHLEIWAGERDRDLLRAPHGGALRPFHTGYHTEARSAGKSRPGRVACATTPSSRRHGAGVRVAHPRSPPSVLGGSAACARPTPPRRSLRSHGRGAATDGFARATSRTSCSTSTGGGPSLSPPPEPAEPAIWRGRPPAGAKPRGWVGGGNISLNDSRGCYCQHEPPSACDDSSGLLPDTIAPSAMAFGIRCLDARPAASVGTARAWRLTLQ